jgi:DNA-binding IscR family transcriptional regulator
MSRGKASADPAAASTVRDAVHRLDLPEELSKEIDRTAESSGVPRSRIRAVLLRRIEQHFGGTIGKMLLEDMTAALSSKDEPLFKDLDAGPEE